MIIELLFDDPLRYVMIIGLVIVSIVLHELGHALSATWQGDSTPRMLGHLTWNPLKHMGWFSLGLVAVIGVGFGATPVQPRNFRNKRWGDVLVSFSGPGVNLVLAFVAAALVTLLEPGAGETLPAWQRLALIFWDIALRFNVLLFVFNMLPVPPFDGFDVLNGFVPLGDLKHMLKRAHPWPMIIAIVLLIQGPLWAVIDAVELLLRQAWAVVL